MTDANYPVVTLVGESRNDELVVEEPLEIRLIHGPLQRRLRSRLTVTMRTPGHDADLAMGLLASEGIITARSDVIDITPMQEENVLRVDLAPGVVVDREKLDRMFAATSSCGLCGKTMLDSIEMHCDPIATKMTVSATVIGELPRTVRDAQPMFNRTGGVHAAALFNASGELLLIREDVGRHNAVDKVLGAELIAGGTDRERILFVSGRAGFELVQKAAMLGVPVMVAVGAPTTLAVDLAERVGLTLVGFVRDGRGNCYSHSGRIATHREKV